MKAATPYPVWAAILITLHLWYATPSPSHLNVNPLRARLLCIFSLVQQKVRDARRKLHATRELRRWSFQRPIASMGSDTYQQPSVWLCSHLYIQQVEEEAGLFLILLPMWMKHWRAGGAYLHLALQVYALHTTGNIKHERLSPA